MALKRKKHQNQAGFSLIELLAVLLIVSIMTSLAGLGLSSILSRRTMDNAAREFAGLVEQAQAYASSQKVPVYVAFAVDTDPAKGGVAISAFVERDDLSAANPYTPIMRARFVSRVLFADAYTISSGGSSSTNGPGVKNITEAQAKYPGTADSGLPKIQANGQSYNASHVIRIGPAGDIRLEPSKLVRSLQFAVRSMRSGDTTPVKIFTMDGLVPSIRWNDGFAAAPGI